MSEYFIHPIPKEKIIHSYDSGYKIIDYNQLQYDLTHRADPETDSLLLKIENKPFKKYARNFKTEVDLAEDLVFKKEHIKRLPNDPFGVFDMEIEGGDTQAPKPEKDITDMEKDKGMTIDTNVVKEVKLHFHPAANRSPEEIRLDTLKAEGLKEKQSTDAKSAAEEVLEQMNLIWEEEARAQEDKLNQIQTRSKDDIVLSQEEIRTERRRDKGRKEGVVQVAPVYSIPRKVIEDADKTVERSRGSIQKLDAIVDEKMQTKYREDKDFEKAHEDEMAEEAAERLANQLEEKRRLEAGEKGFVSQQVSHIDEDDFVSGLNNYTQKDIEELAKAYGLHAPRRLLKKKQIEVFIDHLKNKNISFGDVVTKVENSDISPKADLRFPISAAEQLEKDFKETIHEVHPTSDTKHFLLNLHLLTEKELVDLSKTILNIRNLNEKMSKPKLIVRILKSLTDDPSKYEEFYVRMPATKTRTRKVSSP